MDNGPLYSANYSGFHWYLMEGKNNSQRLPNYILFSLLNKLLLI